MSTMSIQRGLSELKLLDKRISSSMSGATFVSITIGNKPVVGYKDNDAFKEDALSKYQQVTDLINRRNSIKSAIVKANATTEVKIGEEVMTIAEAIERKTSIQYEKDLLRNMKYQYVNAINDYNHKEDLFKSKLDKHLETLYGNEGKAVIKDNKEAIKPFLELNEPNFIDPIDLKKKIEELEMSIHIFESEVDFILSEINVKTDIVID